MAERPDYRRDLTDQLIKQLIDGTAPWQKSWDGRSSMPINPVTGKRYRGGNSIGLQSHGLRRGYPDPRWMTSKQAESKGWRVRDVEKRNPFSIEYWKFEETREKTNEDGSPVLGEDGKPETETVRLPRPMVFFSKVFNAAQIDGIPELQHAAHEWDPIERAEQILLSSGAQIIHDQVDKAFYSPTNDSIHLPQRKQFQSPARYYARALHELCHWTGHPSRLDRKFGVFGDPEYAQEELRMELASLFLADRLGIPNMVNHASYVSSWVKVLKEDKHEIFRASRDAEAITEYVLSLDRERTLQNVQQTTRPRVIVPVVVKPTFPQMTVAEDLVLWLNSNDNAVPDHRRVQSRRGTDSSYTLYFAGTNNEALPGRKFDSAAQARQRVKDMTSLHEERGMAVLLSVSSEPVRTTDEFRTHLNSTVEERGPGPEVDYSKPDSVRSQLIFRGTEEWPERSGMSNFDHEIDEGFEKFLRQRPAERWGRHASGNFNGKVWFEADRFHSEVWVDGSPREVIHADSLRELMNESVRFGLDQEHELTTVGPSTPEGTGTEGAIQLQDTVVTQEAGNNERAGVSSEGQKALGEVVAQQGGNSAGKRGTEPGASDRGEAGAGRNVGVDESSRLPPARSGGGRTEEIHSPVTRGGRGGGAVGQEGTQRARARVPEAEHVTPESVSNLELVGVLGGEGQKALGEVVAQQGGSSGGERETEPDASDLGEAGAGQDVAVDERRRPPARRGARRAEDIHSPAARGGRGGGAVAQEGTQRARARVPEAERVTPESVPNLPAQNFCITPELRLGEGGEVEKFNDNLAAIRALKTIEAERRRATLEEQRLLARYVGWGGLSNAFPDPITGQFKDRWSARGEALKDILTPNEYAAARRSTRNAHYTSETVVSAMWNAAQRLGFRGGLVLESSMGTGNFLGLAPRDVPAKFIGVEYDNVTSRIAAALYPAATVLNSGFQYVPLADSAFALSIGNPPFGSESLRFQYKPELHGKSIHNQFLLAALDAVRPGGLQINVVSRYVMDAQDESDRRALARKARLVAAIRLPSSAFKENARTEVVTDILIFQRHDVATEEAMRQAFSEEGHAPAKGETSQQAAERRRRADMIPKWLATAEVADPLGGEPMVVNAYFKDHPEQVLGIMDRSGSMQKDDIGVTLPATELHAALEKAIARLPERISDLGDEVLTKTQERFDLLSEAMRIAVAKEEPGHVGFDGDGNLIRVIEREAPDGGTIAARQTITPDSPWSDHLSVDSEGRWYRLEVAMGEDGKPVKEVKEGKPTKRNSFKRTTYLNHTEVPASLRLGKTGYERLKGMVNLRDILKKQLVLETEDAPAKMMEANREKLSSAYKTFVDEHGPVNRRVNMNLAMTMPDGGLITALEVKYQPERTQAQAEKTGLEVQREYAEAAPILKSRVVLKYDPPTRAATAADALAISLSERGVVDMERIAELRGVSPEVAIEELQNHEKPLVFMDPETGTWETANAYLSGQVKRKLNAARTAGLHKNIAALEGVQPEPWTAENVTVRLGSTTVPTDVYARFAEHLFGGSARAAHFSATNVFSLSVSDTDKLKWDQWSTDGADGSYILQRVLNSQVPVVMYTDGEGNRKIDKEATELASLKAREMLAEFEEWVFKDGERRQRIVDAYNEKFNVRVNRQYDGSHLTLPGKVPDAVIALRRHQKNAIWRGISSSFGLLDHVVGAGKTYSGIARAMERRRMGLARKPMIAVPNHLVEQWEADIYRLYPAAKILVAGQKDFEKKRRRRLFGRIATGDWDIVVVPHSSFGFIGIAPETEMRFLEKEMRQAKEAIEEAWEQAQEDGTENGFRKPFGVKEAERLAEKIQARMDKVREGARDRLLTFEQLGVDDLTVDEAHEFKNLYYSSRLTGVRGMGNKIGSRKAADLYNKVRVLRENGGAVTFMTGTPVSNSVVELYTMMRYLAADELEENGLTHFDAWRAEYVDATPAFEPTESGRLKEVTRLGRTWSNMRSMMDLYYQFADAVTIDDIKKWYAQDAGKEFPVPRVKSGERQLVKLAPTSAQSQALEAILQGFDGLDDIKDVMERNKQRLRLMDRARKVSLDIRAVDSLSNSKEQGGKLEKIAENVSRIYKATDNIRGTQLVFLDRSVPKASGDEARLNSYDELVAARDNALRAGDEDAFQEISDRLVEYDPSEMEELRNAQKGGWNAYQQIKDNLIALGVPADQICFIQEANTDEKKQAIFDAMNSGKLRVTLGSTARMGAGTNVQARLVALHHADVTWKPSDIEQREGRIIRQGNVFADPSSPEYMESFEVEILAYATERTVDAKMWDLNATKLRAINGLRKYDGAFSMDIEDEESASMAEMAALASGNPLLLERVKLESQINTLELQERAHRRRVFGIQDAIHSARRTLAEHPAKILEIEQRADDIQQRLNAVLDAASLRSVTIEGQTYSSKYEAMKAATGAIDAQKGGEERARFSISINGERYTNKVAVESAIDNAIGDASPFEAKIQGKTVTTRADAARRIVDAANDAVAHTVSGESSEIELGDLYGYRLVGDVSTTSSDEKKDKLFMLDLHVIDGQRTVVSLGAFSDQGKFVVGKVRTLMSELINRIQGLSDKSWAAHYRSQLERAQRDLPELEEKAKGDLSFPQTQELREKRERLVEVVQQLQAERPTSPPEAQNEQADDKHPIQSSIEGGATALTALETLQVLTEVHHTEGRVLEMPAVEQEDDLEEEVERARGMSRG